ncbi:uncharacterized protein LOC115363054 [Myripristis murdjan]|uniref:uncharacterized protein LOC115363054 n=1 Tax=Myripristis murdjan TaxID=586833 RepID=UPI00117614E4|nr:uncharacterized protein LOC115363054 [Myripristis murdjan]
MPGLRGALCQQNLITLKQLIASAGPALADARAVASSLGVHSVRLVQRSLDMWMKKLSAKEKNLLQQYSDGRAEPDPNEDFPEIHLTPDLAGLSGPLLKDYTKEKPTCCGSLKYVGKLNAVISGYLGTLQRRTQLGEFHHLLQEPRLDDGHFQRYFRLTGAQFEELLARVGARISWLGTNYRRSISAAERLSICLRYLATGDSFRTIANSFHVGISTVSTIIPDVVAAIWDCLIEEFMAVPTTEEWLSISGRFEERWNFPLCCGALDGKHVVPKAPANSGSQFYNYKGTFSLVLLAVVDAQYCFRVIDVGGYGKTSDGGILANSAFGQALRSGTLPLPADRPLPGADHRGPQPHVFVADEAFPLRRNLMRPFPGRILPRERRVFNYVCSGPGWWLKMPSGSLLLSGGCTGVPSRSVQS